MSQLALREERLKELANFRHAFETKRIELRRLRDGDLRNVEDRIIKSMSRSRVPPILPPASRGNAGNAAVLAAHRPDT